MKLIVVFGQERKQGLAARPLTDLIFTFNDDTRIWIANFSERENEK